MKIKKVSECIGIEVFTDAGERFGQVEEANLVDNKIDGWRIRRAANSKLIFNGDLEPLAA